MNNFWTSPTFNLLSILVAIIALVFIGMKYGTSLKDKKLHLCYICGICIFLIIELATYICIQSDHSVEIISYISFASTLSSLILSVVAIIYAIVSNNKGEVQYGKIDSASSKITESVSEFSRKSEELTQGLSNVLSKLDEVKNISIETRDRVSLMNRAGLSNPKDAQSDIKQSLSSDQTDGTIDREDKDDVDGIEAQIIEARNQASQDTIDRVVSGFVNTGSFVGNLSLLACVYSRDVNKPFSASDIFPPSQQDNNMYIFGYIIASTSLGVVTVQNINGKFHVISYYEGIKTLLEENIKSYVSRNNDPSQNYNKEAYDFMSNYFGIAQ
ncbi:MAG: hypothetical protein K2M13_06495 [Muribaculaceae bacterium]|nr:hypothetical protein [Muribaculaceae bacterium]